MAVDPVRMLWLSVIEQAFVDASSKGGANDSNASATWAEKLDAHNWLIKDSRDREFVCRMAGIAQRQVTEAYFAFIKSGMSWAQFQQNNMIGCIIFDTDRGRRIKR